jgi:hypothetical protein
MQPPATAAAQHSSAWLFFALMTVASWGVYGVFLHNGQTQMQDAVNGRYKAFLFVGVAYFLVAIIAPLMMLILSGANWKYPLSGMGWSLVAGMVGAVGAFGVLLAFGAAPQPKAAYIPVVMSIIFAGAPIVNAFASMVQHPPAGGIGAIKPGFWLGIVLAATGGFLATYYKPGAAPAHKPAPPAAAVEQKAEPAAK